MATRADNDTLTFFQTQSELAKWTGLAPGTVIKNVNKAIAKGWLVKLERGNSRRATSYRLAFGETRSPGANLSAVSDCISGDTVRSAATKSVAGASKLLGPKNESDCIPGDAGLYPWEPKDSISRDTPTSPATSPLTSPSLKIGACFAAPDEKNLEDEEEKPLLPLPSDWRPDGNHCFTAAKGGWDAVELGCLFRYEARRQGRKSHNWNARFQRLINAVLDDDEYGVLDQEFAWLQGIWDDEQLEFDGEVSWMEDDRFRVTPPMTLTEAVKDDPELKLEIRYLARETDTTTADVVSHIDANHQGEKHTPDDWIDHAKNTFTVMLDSETGEMGFRLPPNRPDTGDQTTGHLDESKPCSDCGKSIRATWPGEICGPCSIAAIKAIKNAPPPDEVVGTGPIVEPDYSACPF